MSTPGMQKLVGAMVTSDRFRTAVLFNRNPGLFDGFDLTLEELSVLMALPGENLEGFAQGVESYIDSRKRVVPGKPAGAEKG